MSLPREMTADLFRAIAEYTYDWETWVDAQGSTRWVNGAVTRITGYSVAECLALPEFPLPLAHEADRPVLERVLADARVGGSGNDVEFRVRSKSGDERWVAISWQSVKSPEQQTLGYRTSIRDIHERKLMEGELHRLRQRAEALAQTRSELLANVSHELRSPIHCIAGFAELLMQSQLSDKQRRYASFMVAQCRSMQRQVEDLLSLTALEAGGVQLSREAVDLGTLAEGLIEAGQAVARERNLSLSAELELKQRVVEADGLRLTQILRNLIDNALKFTEHGGIRLRLSQLEGASGPSLCCEVIDTGAGMDEAQLDKLLLPFRQGDAGGSRRQGGVGLGLAIVQRMVRAMDGELSIRSRIGVGTHVTVRLPWLRAQVPDDARLSELPLRPGRALVVDDSAAARELLLGLLESCGFTGVEAASAKLAAQLVAEQPFDLVFLDYQMPDCDGAEAALLLRRRLSERSPRHVPIFFLTANVFIHEQKPEARASVDGVLAKPLSRAALLRVLARANSGMLWEGKSAADEGPLLSEDVVSDLVSTPHRSGKSLLHKLLPQVERDMSEALAEARSQLAVQHSAGLRHVAHTLAGHAGLLGAARAAAAARSLELLFETPSASMWERAQVLLEACAQAWHTALPALQARCELDKS
jgi:PAS domain S-box-containing protein